MERSLFVFVPWVGLQMVSICVLALAGLMAVTVRLARDADRPGNRHASAGQLGGQRPVEPLTPDWLERLISGVGHPPVRRPRLVETGDADREVA